MREDDTRSGKREEKRKLDCPSRYYRIRKYLPISVEYHSFDRPISMRVSLSLSLVDIDLFCSTYLYWENSLWLTRREKHDCNHKQEIKRMRTPRKRKEASFIRDDNSFFTISLYPDDELDLWLMSIIDAGQEKNFDDHQLLIIERQNI